MIDKSLKMKSLHHPRVFLLYLLVASMFMFVGYSQRDTNFSIASYLQLGDQDEIYPSDKQLDMLASYIPEEAFQPAPSIRDREYWNKIAKSTSGKNYVEEAISLLDRKPEVPITDDIYRRANKEGNRGIYKPRYYRTMDRLEHFILGECIENKGRFLEQIAAHSKAIMDMKSWLHPNHDDKENSVLEGKRVAIDLGARKFGLVLALADVLLGDVLPGEVRTQITTQLRWRIVESYFKSCKGEDTIGNRWIRSRSNWNAVCTSGTVATMMMTSKNRDERIAAIGCALNSMKYYISGFGDDGYCSEGIGYWNYGFGHYLYLAQILHDYSNGTINLFDFDNPEKLKKVANFPKNFQIHTGLYAPFSDGGTRVKKGNDNFSYMMAAKHYGSQKPQELRAEEAAYQLIGWYDQVATPSKNEERVPLPEATYFDDYGVIISRGQQQLPLSIAMKAGHNAENHNHSDVGSYVIALGDGIITGDIGAPSYRAGAFAPDNKARSSWGHPVPKIKEALQRNGPSFSGKVIETEFSKERDQILMDISKAYDVPTLQKLERTMINTKNTESGHGAIHISDTFLASEPIPFGTAIMTLSNYKIVDDHTIIFTKGNQKLKAEISSDSLSVVIKDELVPVEHLREGGPAYRIGIDFEEPTNKGTITITYTPIVE